MRKFYPILYQPNECKTNVDYTKSKITSSGVSEQYFVGKLKISIHNAQIIEKTKILKYFPDILLVTHLSHCLIIEIDEKYCLQSKSPTHYIDVNGKHMNSERDIYFKYFGIATIRFSENQIIDQSESCIEVIKHIVATLDMHKTVNYSDIDSIIEPEPTWSYEDANLSASKNERKNKLIEKGLWNSLTAIAQGYS